MHPQAVPWLERDNEGLARVHVDSLVIPHGIGQPESEVSKEACEGGRVAHFGERHPDAIPPAQDIKFPANINSLKGST
jgi:hypothetical protein